MFMLGNSLIRSRIYHSSMMFIAHLWVTYQQVVAWNRNPITLIVCFPESSAAVSLSTVGRYYHLSSHKEGQYKKHWSFFSLLSYSENFIVSHYHCCTDIESVDSEWSDLVVKLTIWQKCQWVTNTKCYRVNTILYWGIDFTCAEDVGDPTFFHTWLSTWLKGVLMVAAVFLLEVLGLCMLVLYWLRVLWFEKITNT